MGNDAIRKICSWDMATRGQMSLEAVRALHLPINRHYFSESTLPAGAVAHPSRRYGFLYALKGTCVYGGTTISEGDIVEIDEGTYEVHVSTPSDFTFIEVFPVPFEISQK